ncbi:MAG: metallophosphoesterase family protein [Proteobacteria bacterium]|nr:metallophosphoesterase family protein [Pseudomonadota bacterium]
MTAGRSPEQSPGLAPVLDLGSIDGPVLCFGGPYSNVQATDAMLARARALGLAAQQIICTGDVVAYAADPAATVERVRDAGIQVVMGNCEESLGFNAADCGCGFEQGSACAHWSEAWFTHAASQLDEDALAWMRALPRQLRFTLAGRRFAVIHGGDENISEYIFASTPAAAKARIFERLSRDAPSDGLIDAVIDAVIGGHSGLPFTQTLGSRLWHNPGAIGMPANDGTPRGWYSVLTAEDGGIGIALHALDYDHAAAAGALRAVNPGLPYAETFETGLWPNMDVMPETERRDRGRPLAPGSVLWTQDHIAAAE